MMMSWYAIDKDLQGEDEDEAMCQIWLLLHDPEWVTEPIDSAGKCL